jgi:hypothetical protein
VAGEGGEGEEVKKTYRLPDGGTTTSVTKYTNAWRDLGEIVGKAINMRAVACDPGIRFEGAEHETVNLDAITAFRIRNLVFMLQWFKGWFDGYYGCCNDTPLPAEFKSILDQISEPEDTPEGTCKCGQHAQKHTKTCAACFADEAEYLLEDRVQW